MAGCPHFPKESRFLWPEQAPSWRDGRGGTFLPGPWWARPTFMAGKQVISRARGPVFTAGGLREPRAPHLPAPLLRQCLTEDSRPPVPHRPPTLPAHPIAPRVTALFPWRKNVLKGKRCADAEGVKQEPAEALKATNSTGSNTALSRGKRTASTGCVASNGGHLEGD